MIGHLTVLYVIHGYYMIVFHLEVPTIIVEGCTCLPIVRGIDVKTSVKHIGGRICIIITGVKITRFHIV
jgi:hypothetical protein